MAESTFFERQWAARRATTLLLVAEATFLLLLSAGTYYLFLTSLFLVQLFSQSDDLQAGSLPAFPSFSPEVFALVSLIAMTLVLTATYRRYREFRRGGVYVAKRLGGRRIYPSTEDPRELLLLHVVTEISIAAGRPPPLVFVLQDDKSINAFAAGWRPDGSAIGVSAGALQYLNREELQGVVAHEFSHILNGDVRLNMALSAVVHGVNVFYLLGNRLLQPVTERRRADQDPSSHQAWDFPFPLLVVGGLLCCYGLAGRLFATILSAAVSRHRELLADACATQYTRNPSGIAGALKKIGGLQGSCPPTRHVVDSMEHFFFAPFSNDLLVSILSTHPDLTYRVRQLEPSFNGSFTTPEVLHEYDGRHLQTRFQLATMQDFSQRRVSMLKSDAVDYSGVVSAEALDLAAALVEQIPLGLRILASEPYGARAVVYSLLLTHSDEEQMLPQVDAIIRHEDDEIVRDRVALAIRLLKRLDFAYYLPLLDCALSALQELSPDEYQHFREVCTRIADRKAHPADFDYVVAALVDRQIARHQQVREGSGAHDGSRIRLDIAQGQLLAIVARAGATSEDAARAAYTRGQELIRELPDFASLSDRRALLRTVGTSVRGLSRADERMKQRFLTACGAVIEHDGVTSVKEWSMLQAIAQSIGIPMALKAPITLSDDKT